MAFPRLLRVLTLAVAGCGAALAAQGPAPKRQEVLVLGASVSSGFEDPTSRRADGLSNRTLKLDAAMKLAWPREMVRYRNFANMAFFLSPEKSGRTQIDFAKKQEPDLVVALDFVFWFGYGRGGRERDGVVEQQRLARQKLGLAMLEELSCPILLGDYPDMRGASNKMLPPSMIPNARTIEALNEELRKWAKGRENVHLFPLAKFVEDAVGRDLEYQLGARKVVFPRNYLLQSDRLHATRLGVLVLVRHVADHLPWVLGADHPMARTEVTLLKLVEAADAGADLPR